MQALKQSGSPWRSLGRLLRTYGVIAIGVILYKIASRMRKSRSMWKRMEGIPQALYKARLGGVILDFAKNKHRLHDWRVEMTEGLPVSKFRLIAGEPDMTYIIVKDPAGIKHFLKDNFDNYTKPSKENFPIAYFLDMWLGGGIFVIQHGPGASDKGRAWQKQRKLASNIFSRGNFKTGMQDAFAAKSRQFVEIMKASAAEGGRVDIQQHFFNFTMDSIMQIFFGETSDALGGGENMYGTAFDAAHRNMLNYIFASIAILLPMRLLPWPLGGFNGLCWKLHRALHPKMRAFNASYKILDSESRRIIAASRADPTLKDRKDILALFLQQEEGEKFTPEFLRDVVMNLVIAGRDTTACTLSWMFYILATNPEIQRKLQEEVDRKMSASSGDVLTFNELKDSEMPYLHGLLYETFRLYPPVPVNLKEAVADDVLPDGSLVPKDCKLIYLPYVMGREASIYPDPMEVRPERWIPFSAPPPHEFPVFQAGPRICLGMDMAIFEAKLVATKLIRHFSFELAPGEAEKIHYANTLTMSVCNSKQQDSHNLWVIPKLRET